MNKVADEDDMDPDADDAWNSTAWHSSVSEKLQNKKAREDFDPDSRKFRHHQREENFIQKRNKMQPSHLQCSYALEQGEVQFFSNSVGEFGCIVNPPLFI